MLNFAFGTGQIYKERVICSCSLFNGLFSLDIKTGEAEFINVFPNEGLATRAIHRNSFLYKDYIGFIPANGNGLSIYDLKKGIFKFYELGHGQTELCIIGGKVWIFSVRSNEAVACFDVDDEKLTWYPQITSWNNKAFQKVFLYNDIIWAVEYMSCNLLWFNPQTLEHGSIAIDSDCLITGSSGDNGLWLICKENCKVLCYNPVNKEICEYELLEMDNSSKQKYSGFITINDSVYLMPLELVSVRKKNDKGFIKVETDSCNVNVLSQELTPFFSNALIYENNIILCPFGIDSLFIVDTKEQKVNVRKITWKNEYDYPMEKYYMELKNTVIKEDTSFTLLSFLSFI